MSSVKDNQRIIDKFRNLVTIYIQKLQYETALYWSNKVVTLSSGLADDVLRFAECLYLTKQYHRAAHALQNRNLDRTDLRCCYLTAKCLYEAEAFEEASLVLDNANEMIEKVRSGETVDEEPIVDDVADRRRSLGSIFLLRGLILEALDNRGLATASFKAALKEDVYCYEAFQALVRHQILTAEEEMDLIANLPYDAQCSKDEEEEEEEEEEAEEQGGRRNVGDAKIVQSLYEISAKKYDRPFEDPFSTEGSTSHKYVPSSLECLRENCDVMVNVAEIYYYNCDYTECYKLTAKVMKYDPFHTECLPIHISCMVELNNTNGLFYLAHKLVDLYPESCISWYAVGCYYYLVGKHEPARRYLSKATQLNRVFGPAWLTYGHSFAMENEHDQAMAAYFKACQLMKGCHLPLLYIGVEYSLTNNSNLAKTFFSEALCIAPVDPFVLHEMGVIAFQDHDYAGAEQHFLKALDRIEGINNSTMSSKWEPLLNNLGHCSRKLGKYKESLNFHRQALILKPLTASTYSAIGYVHSLMGNLMEAVEAFHKALGIRRDDTFSTSMLNNVIEQLMGVVLPFPDYPDNLPKFEVLSGKKSTEEKAAEEKSISTMILSSTVAHDSSSIDIDMTDMSESGMLDNSL